MPLPLSRRLTGLLGLLLVSACIIRVSDTAGDSDAGSATGTTATTATSGTSGTSGTSVDPTGPTTVTSDGTTGPDPDYKRECQPGDFICDDWGCPWENYVLSGECYKPCTPDTEPGAEDPECDEPERPFCSQVGQAFGGDFNCNGCAHICVSGSFDVCEYAIDQCD